MKKLLIHAFIAAFLFLPLIANAGTVTDQCKTSIEKWAKEDNGKYEIIRKIVGGLACIAIAGGEKCFEHYDKNFDDFLMSNGEYDETAFNNFLKTDCASDKDGDGKHDWEDNCPLVASDDFKDSDNDGIGDICEEVTPKEDPLCTSEIITSMNIAITPTFITKNGKEVAAVAITATDVSKLTDVSVVNSNGDAYTCAVNTPTSKSVWDDENDGGAASSATQKIICTLDKLPDNTESVSVTYTYNDDTQKCLASASANFSTTVIADADGDGIKDDVDNCVNQKNADQADEDSDGTGNACDPDFSVSSDDLGRDCSLNPAATANGLGWLIDLFFLGLPAALIGLRRK